MQFSSLILIILLFYDNIQNYKLYIYICILYSKKLENNSELKIVTFIKSTNLQSN